MAGNPEIGLISALVRQQDHQTILDQGITEEFFHAYPDEGKWILHYIASYRKTPSKPAFKAQFPEFRILLVDDLAHYCDLVRKRHSEILTSGVISKAADLLSLGQVQKAIETMHTGSIKISSVCNVMHDKDIITDWEHDYKEFLLRKQRYEEDGYAGIPTGFPTFDERMGGFTTGLHIVSARLGQGKSWLLMSMAVTALVAGKSIQFDSLEMPRSQVSGRVHALLSKQYGQTVFDNISLAQGKNIDPTEYRKFLVGMRKSLRSRMHVMDSSKGRMGVLDVQAQIERNEPDAVFIDYITLMKMGGEDWSSVVKLSNDLTILANEYDIPIICAAQLNREAVTKKDDPGGPENLSRGDSIGQDATSVFANKLTSKRTMIFKNVKNRHGEQDLTVYLHYEPTAGIIKEISYEAYLDLRDQDKAEEK